MRNYKFIGVAAGLALAIGTSFCTFADDNTPSSLGCSQTTSCGTADIDQISGNMATLRQAGSSNSANLEQQAILGIHGNVIALEQNGINNTAAVIQKGSHDTVDLTQTGNGHNATIEQNGSNLGVQINQAGGPSSIGITQFGNSPAGMPPITIKQFN